MAGFDQSIRIRGNQREGAAHFFAFLNAVGRKFTPPVKVGYRYRGKGWYYVTVDGGPGGIDSLFQELILNRGLYYYACALRVRDKKKVLADAVIPIFQDLLEARFSNTFSRYLKKHLLGKAAPNEFVPGEFHERFAHEYEVLFRKWDLGSIGDWDFVKDTDSLLTQFLLATVDHKPGTRSPVFHLLLDGAQKKGIALLDEFKSKFKDIHDARTMGLHRRSEALTGEELTRTAMWLLSYFAWYDELMAAQSVRTEILHGQRYRRIRYGSEEWDWGAASRPCHDCAAVEGQLHADNCDVERCARCGGQRLSCGCKLQSDY